MKANINKIYQPTLPMRSIHNIAFKPILLSLNEFGLTAENSFIKYLIPESNTLSEDQFTPRQIKYIHYVYALPGKIPNQNDFPKLVAASASCAEALGLDPK